MLFEAESVSRRKAGVFFAVAAAVTYGMNPLFALPLYREGFDADTVLLFRYLPAALLLGIWTAMKGEGFRLTKREMSGTFVCGMLFSLSSLFLYLSYLRMDAGIASTLLFVYPAMVALIMAFGFRERISVWTWFCVGLSFGGIALLCRTPRGGFLDWIGVLYVMLSSLTYAVYLVWLNRDSALKKMPALKLTFYIVVFGVLLYLTRLRFGLDAHGRFSAWTWMNIAGISLLSMVLSLVCTTLALQRVGPTVTAILGALEPVTAVFFGVTVFGERLTWRILLGMALILGAVVLTALRKERENRKPQH